MSWLGDIPWWGMVALKATVWLTLCWMVVRGAQKSHPRLRALLCRASVCSLLVLMVLAVKGPVIHYGVVRSPGPALAVTNRREPKTRADVREHVTTKSAATAPIVEQPKGRAWNTPRLDGWLVIVYLSVAGVLVLRTGFALWASFRIARSGIAAEESLRFVCNEVARDMGVGRPPRLNVSEYVSGPVLAGIVRQTILIPSGLAGTLSKAELRGVFAHELAHVRTWDACWKLVLEVVCAVTWFHPGMWDLARQHDAACEEACDAVAAKLDESGGAYRRLLASLALGGSSGRIGLAIPMARSAQITRRIRALASPCAPLRMNMSKLVLPMCLATTMIAGLASLECYQRGPEGLYETAPAATGASYTLGPTTFTLDAVARYAGDGSVAFEDGRGQPATWIEPPDFGAAARWMDVAAIKIGPDEDVFDITELRIFDHATQTMLGQASGGEGFFADGHVLRAMRMGSALPESLDVWMRIRHRPASDPSWRIPAKAGASATIDGVPVVVREVHEGSGSYTMRGGKITWTGPETNDERTSIVVDLKDPNRTLDGRRFQLCAIDDQGQRHWSDFFVSANNGLTHVPAFEMAAKHIQFVELSPLHEERRFYFDDVRLPPRDSLSFSSPPDFVVDVDGTAGEFALNVAGEGDFRVATYAGDAITGTSYDQEGPHFNFTDEPGGDGATVSVVVDGLVVNSASLEFLAEDGKVLGGGRNRAGRCSGSVGTAVYRSTEVPLTNVAKVRVTFSGKE